MRLALPASFLVVLLAAWPAARCQEPPGPAGQASPDPGTQVSLLLAENAALRGRLSALQGQLRSLEMLRLQEQQGFSAIEIQAEERAALLAVAADELRACQTERGALDRDLLAARPESAARDELKTKLAQKLRETVSRLAALQSRCDALEAELAIARARARAAAPP